MSPWLSAPRSQFERWLFRPTGPRPGPIVLGHRQIFIVPSRLGLGFTVLLLILLVGSLNYELSLGYVLTFWLVGIGHASMYHCYRNQSRLSVRYGKCQPVFAGQRARFEIVLDNLNRHARRNVQLALPGEPSVAVDVPAQGSTEAYLERPATSRGYLLPGRMTISNRYPLGLFYAWSYADFDARCLVYPEPEAHVGLPVASGYGRQGRYRGAGQDDFAGLRPHRPGDSLRHIAWKSAARGDTLLTKQFIGSEVGSLWLRWDDMPHDFDVERRLSRLTAWVLQAERAGLDYGLRLPNGELAPAHGPHHEQLCLQALALYGQEPS